MYDISQAMQILIGCAKDMDGGCPCVPEVRTEPMFAARAAANAMQMLRYSDEEISEMLGCGMEIARESRRRYMRFHDEGDGLQAVLAYTGIVFKYLDAGSLTADELDFAQQHLWITSFLYGLLRPMDMIKPYRLEGDVVLPGNGVSMFDYWKPLLTDVLIDSVKADGGVLLDLASKEMRRLFDWRRVERSVRVVTPQFMVRRDGRLKTVVVYAKMCRGAMVRHVITRRIGDPSALGALAFEGFEFAGNDTKGGNHFFVM